MFRNAFKSASRNCGRNSLPRASFRIHSLNPSIPFTHQSRRIHAITTKIACVNVSFTGNESLLDTCIDAALISVGVAESDESDEEIPHRRR